MRVRLGLNSCALCREYKKRTGSSVADRLLELLRTEEKAELIADLGHAYYSDAYSGHVEFEVSVGRNGQVRRAILQRIAAEFVPPFAARIPSLYEMVRERLKEVSFLLLAARGVPVATVSDAALIAMYKRHLLCVAWK